MFAGLNLFRQLVSKKLNVEDFEFSQNYMMFFDKLEKANYFLESVLRTLNEDVDSRIVMWLMKDPLQDGGQWDMFTSLIKKYGAIPKPVMPETFHSNNSNVMNQLLTAKLRQWAAELREESGKGSAISNLREKKEKYIVEFYRLLSCFLGDPPDSFLFEYNDKKGKHQQIGTLRPIEFYNEFVGIDPDDYISLIHAPTPDKPFNRSFTIDFLGNVVGGKEIRYLNIELDEFKKLAVRQIKDREPVWFGCDVRLQVERKKGLMDPKVYMFDHALGTTFNLDKTRRLLYGESLLSHAMVFTGVNIRNGKTDRWKVENSWGEDRGEKGFFVMSDSWFDEYNYQIVVHRKHISGSMLKAYEADPVVLPPWDPMGSLAMVK